MISTLTLSTVSAAINGSLSGILASLGILLLLSLLCVKELASSAGTRFQSVSKIVNIAILPLLIAFVLIVVSQGITVIG
ncbi:MAG: hypothetical protein LLG44_00730 [Chloroflexi bacterium]|nr:hypothetical protein [Chloroflexota bacterium]